MPQRETREVTTPGGHKIVLKSYLTGRETNELKAMMYGALKMNMGDAQSGKVNMGDISGTFLVDQERKAFELLLVSVDGDATAPVDKLLDLPASEYDAVKKEIDLIQNPSTPPSAGQPGEGTSQAA